MTGGNVWHCRRRAAARRWRALVVAVTVLALANLAVGIGAASVGREAIVVVREALDAGAAEPLGRAAANALARRIAADRGESDAR